MKKTLLIAAVAAVVQMNVDAQTLDWVKQTGSAGFESPFAIAVDAAGNVYTGGLFNGTVDFDPGPGIFDLTSAGNTDCYIQKLDASGNFVWARRLGGSDAEEMDAVSIDAAGNVYVSGSYKQTGDFDPGSGVYNLTSMGDYDIFITKLDASGNFLWATSWGGTSLERSHGMVADASGNVYSTGFFELVVDFDPGAGSLNLTAQGPSDIYVAKLDPSGALVWAKQCGGPSGEGGSTISLDQSGNVYTTGVFAGTVDFDPGPGIFTMTDNTNSDLYAMKLDASGNFLWAKQFGTQASCYTQASDVDAAGNFYISGIFQGSGDFDPGPGISTLTVAVLEDGFVLKLDAAGDFVWVQQLTGDKTKHLWSLDLDDSANIYIAGWFYGNVDFDPGAGTASHTATSTSGDIFITRLNSAGTFQWVKQIGSTGNDQALCMTTDAAGKIYIGARFEGTVDFDPGAATLNLTSAGNRDAVVIKMSQGPTGIRETEDKFDGLIFPNPTQTFLSIKCKQPVEEVRVYNSVGTLVQVEPKNAFSVAGLAAGVYLLQVRTASGLGTAKFVKE